MRYKLSVLIVYFLLVICLASYFIPSLKMASRENRTMATFFMVLHPEENSVVYHAGMIERLESALSDQFPFRDLFIRQYLWTFNRIDNLSRCISRQIVASQDNQYAIYSIGNYEMIEEVILRVSLNSNRWIHQLFIEEYRSLPIFIDTIPT